jgi:DNA end-binding protein Ku
MAATVWKGYITFGLISIPVRLYAAARSEHVSFHQVHAVCNTRIKQQLYCPHCERVVARSELVKGYEASKGVFTDVTDQELKDIEPASTDTMEVSSFVHLKDIDPLYYDTSYYAVPEEPGKKAYHLLIDVMEKSGYVALAKVGMHRREYIVAIRPRDNGLTLHTMFYPNEVRAVPEYGAKDNVSVKPKEVELAQELVKKLAGPFRPEEFTDEYRNRVLKLVEAKSEGKELEGTPHKRMAPVIDLMQALQKSLQQGSSAARKPSARAKASTAAHGGTHGRTPARTSARTSAKKKSAHALRRAS